MADIEGNLRPLALDASGTGGTEEGDDIPIFLGSAEDAAEDGNLRGVGLASGGGIGDTIPPTFTVVSPAEGTPVSPDTVIVVEITDNAAIALAPLYAEFPGHPSAEMVYNGTALLAPYAALSSVVDLGDGGRRLSLRRTGGWPGDVSLTSIATDTSGNEVA